VARPITTRDNSRMESPVKKSSSFTDVARESNAAGDHSISIPLNARATFEYQDQCSREGDASSSARGCRFPYRYRSRLDGRGCVSSLSRRRNHHGSEVKGKKQFSAVDRREIGTGRTWRWTWGWQGDRSENGAGWGEFGWRTQRVKRYSQTATTRLSFMTAKRRVAPMRSRGSRRPARWRFLGQPGEESVLAESDASAATVRLRLSYAKMGK